MAISTFKRKEIKFILDEDQYQSLNSIIGEYMNPDAFCVDGKEYGIYNIYYDTADNYLIRESLEKPYYKEKIRLRSYFSPAKDTDNVYLEIKKKIGGIVTKRRISLTLAQANAFIFEGELPDFSNDKKNYIQNQVLRELIVFLKTYPITPKQYISYQRSAYFGKEDDSFRLTFDRSITQRRFDVSLSEPNYGSQLLLPSQHLMEVKISSSMPMWLSQKLAELGVYKTSFSKYGRAFRSYITETH
ncbi:MAG: polyphosphate polymerase domain-containing protein [Oscillospiraceae bacterium]|nr:polyphosphate polymerase domain-containing protein [Oscillospiraceae bacterium]